MLNLEIGTPKVISTLKLWLSSFWTSRVLLILSGTIYPLAFSPFEIWPLAFISVFVLLVFIIVATYSESVKLTPFKSGLYWGIGAFSVGISWVNVSIHEFGFVPLPGALAITLVFVLVIALFKGLFGYCCGYLLRRCQLPAFILIAPLCWFISEYVQSNFLTGFPWLLLGYSQIDSPLAAISTWFGVYGVSWIAVAMAACLVLLLFSANRRKYIFCLSVIIGVVIAANISRHYNPAIPGLSEKIDVALVQPNIPQEKKWDRQYFSKILNVLFDETKSLWNADIIVWPEGAIPVYAHQVKKILEVIDVRAREFQSNLLLGIAEYEKETGRSYVALKSFGGENQSYYKQVLVPFGEFVPFENWLRGLIKFLDMPMSGFTKADEEQNGITLEKLILIPAICYEIVYPSIIYDLSSRADPGKPQMIVTVSNDAWFGDSFGPYQHMQMARMRALELGIPLIRSTNDGITAIVDEQGGVVKQLPRYQQAYLRHTFMVNNRMTLYRKWGFWSGGILLILSSLFILLSWHTTRNSDDRIFTREPG